jgi:hypothetical protein
MKTEATEEDVMIVKVEMVRSWVKRLEMVEKRRNFCGSGSEEQDEFVGGR